MQAVILAGGTGTRFWPLSRRRRPKQLLELGGDVTLLRQTVDRLDPLVPASSIWICTTRALAAAVAREVPEVPVEQILAEPEGRNTAAAIGWSVRSMPAALRDGVIAVLPADHRVADPAAFRATLATSARCVAEQGLVMTLGVEPRRPETGFGYLETGEILDAAIGLRRVVRFTEKPELEEAEEFLAAGNYLWNGGIFTFRGSHLLELLSRFEPEIAAGLDQIAETPEDVAPIYATLPKVSIDVGVMERVEELGTLSLDCGWSDLGSWEALAELGPEDDDGNIVRGDVVAEDATGNLLWADQGNISVVGISGLVVVRTGDAVLVVPRERSQAVKQIVEALDADDRDDLL